MAAGACQVASSKASTGLVAMRSVRRHHLIAWLIVTPVTFALLLLAILVRKPPLSPNQSAEVKAARLSTQPGDTR